MRCNVTRSRLGIAPDTRYFVRAIDRIAALDPLAVRLSKQVMAMPASAHPVVDNIAQAILFESDAKFDRMQAFLDRKKK